jgi:mono/diheme cytochrome c family protein
MRRALALAGSLAALAVGLGALTIVGDAGGAASETGDPTRGAAVFQSKQCWSCHAFAAAGSAKGKSGPDLDRWLRPHAAQLKLTPERLAAGRITNGGRGMPAYVRELSAGELADLVAFLVGRSVSLTPESVQPVRPAPVPPPETTASSVTVARWKKAKRLNALATRGARVFAREGCLSCHRYLGSGRSRFAGGDLTNGTPTKRSIAGTVSYLSDPARSGNPLMPGYRDLGAANLRAVAAFLDASRRARR